MDRFNNLHSEELIGAYQYALQARATPSMISVARDPVGPVPSTSRSKVFKGAYVIKETPDAQLTLVSCGSELHYVVCAAEQLEQQRGLKVRLVSAPSLNIFDSQDAGYKDSVFPHDGSPIISAEEYVPLIWARYVTASIGMTGYGYSASNESNYARFGLNAEAIVQKITQYLKDLNGRDARRDGWRML
jgi:dihydroxyacetone synthase